MEFTKDKEAKVSAKVGGATVNMGGTYEVDGTTLKLTLKGTDGKDRAESLTIKKLDDTELVTVEKEKDAQGKEKEKETTFKRKS